MQIFFSVGEPSGDLHAANLIEQLRIKNPEVNCVGYGGPRMAAAGCRLHFELTQLAVMFFLAAVAKLRVFFRLIAQAEKYFCQHKVDAVILVDYPGFNWWIARKAKRHGIPVFYYGVPQMWAWAPWRVAKIRKLVDHVLCKLPFEVSWFAERNCRAIYVGHPFFDQLQKQRFDHQFMTQFKKDEERLVTLLPGSRNQEVQVHLPILFRAATEIRKRVPNVKIAVACYNEHQLQLARQEILRFELPADLLTGKTAELMQLADACLACSGSVSLELMYYRKPTVIIYRLSRFIMWLQCWALRIKFITLVNLMATDSIQKVSWRTYDPDAPGAENVPMPEYLTAEDKSSQMAEHVVGWLTDEALMAEKVQQLDRLARKYGWPGASQRAADFILTTLAGRGRITRHAA